MHQFLMFNNIKVCVYTSVSADVLDVVALAVREVAAVAAGVQLAGEVVSQVLPPVVLADRGVGTQSAAEHPAQAERHTVKQDVGNLVHWLKAC